MTDLPSHVEVHEEGPREGFQIDSRFVEPAEIYPSSKFWGTDGFTFTNKDAASAKFRKLASASGEAAP